ncbi:lipopolysaccharide biosynthesis protein [Krasilnikovia sp. M28-CT-15]|uniref:lipopolysaccharide biosynthesis protein n=1 Tax=Krasilnikovia sp. M28-CT-15 TaxID=3373540 RepID=UPI0038761AF9
MTAVGVGRGVARPPTPPTGGGAGPQPSASGGATPGAEVRRSARSGVVGLLGAAVNGACGFVLTAVVVRVLGAPGAGAMFSVIGLVSILGPLCCLGADTALMWALPRRAAGPSGDAARLLPLAVVPTLGLAVLVAAAGWVVAPAVDAALLGSGDATLVRLAFVGLPVFTVATVLLAAVRATRPVTTYVGVQLVAVPLARPLLIGVAVAAGGSVTAAFAGWLLPLAAAAVAAGLLVAGPLGVTRARLRPTAADRRWFWGFALPRAVSTVIDAGGMWFGVLLTAALAGPAEAGVFGAVCRYALAGLLVMQGLRVAIAPQLSRLLGAGRRAEAAAVHRRITAVVVLLSWPAYLLLAVFAPAFLALFGAPFAAGAAPMAVLAVAMLVNVGVGTVQTVLLMSGNSRGHLAAAASGLALYLLGCLVLVPRHGALGAAVAWSVGIVAENVIAAVLVRRTLGEPLAGRALAGTALAALAGTGAAAAVGVAVAGRGPAGLALALGLLAVGALVPLGNARVRAGLRAARALVRPGRAGPQQSAAPAFHPPDRPPTPEVVP